MNQREHEDLLMTGEGSVQVVHAREVAALIESLGYTDQSAKERGFPDIFSLADHLFARLEQNPTPFEVVSRCSLWGEIRCALRKFSLSLAYAIPWIVMLSLEYWRPDALQVSPGLGGALSLSLMGSLITAGGFVQMISRSGTFYHGLKEPVLARRICMSLLSIGLTSSFVAALIGLLAGSYFHLFSGDYLVIAAINYLALSVLWMLCAILSVQENGWCIPFIFLLAILISGLVKILLNPGTTILLMLGPLVASSLAFGCMLAGSYGAERDNPQSKNSAPPRMSVMFISLMRFYIYGTVYFSFLFADRLSAGSAVPWTSGLSFGIDTEYKRATDLVLLAFLITAALVEYFSDSLFRLWQRLAAELPQAAGDRLRASLRKRHSQSMLVVVATFALIAMTTWFAFFRLSGLGPTPKLLLTSVLGGLGYLMLSVALLEIIILASVDAISIACLAVGVGVAVNLITGYGLSHLLGVQYAAAGLLAGSAVVLWITNAAVRHVLRHPDYHYSVS